MKAFERYFLAANRWALILLLTAMSVIIFTNVVMRYVTHNSLEWAEDWMLGLKAGDAKIFRNPGGRVTPQALEALVLGVHLLNVKRILIAPHTRCAMASNTEDELRSRISESAGIDASWQPLGVVADQMAALEQDVAKVRSHPLIPETVPVGGFLYDVDTGLLAQHF